MNNDFKTPLFFKVWFAFVAILALSIIGVAGFGVFSIASDPAVIGRIAGQVVSGFKETAE